MNWANLIYLGLAILLLMQLIVLLTYKSREREHRNKFDYLREKLKQSEDFIKRLQDNMNKIREKEQELSNTFIFLPEFISKLTSYNEKRDIFNIVIAWIDRLLQPKSSHIFIEKDGFWNTAVQRNPDDAAANPRCARDEGILSVVHDLKMTIDVDDFSLLSVERQDLIQNDPLSRLDIQVCAPMVYDNEVYGIIALSGVPNYSQQKKVLVNMVSDLAASSLVNSMLFSRFRHLATRDPLTDLVNKRGFEKAMLQAIVKGSREKKSFSVFIFDIDFFKKYNDTNGHQAGDEALRITAGLLRRNFRSGDIKARYGGEEFIVLMNKTGKEQAFRLAEKFRQKVEAHPYPHEKTQPTGKLTISGGVSTFPLDGANIKEIIEKADEALYEAKQEGRNMIKTARSTDFSDTLEMTQDNPQD